MIIDNLGVLLYHISYKLKSAHLNPCHYVTSPFRGMPSHFVRRAPFSTFTGVFSLYILAEGRDIFVGRIL